MRNVDTTADRRSAWAENMPAFGPDTIVLEGEDARRAIADLLDGPPAVGGEEEVARRLRGRGRPALNPSAPVGAKARQVNVRLPRELEVLVRTAVETKLAKSESELVRTALTEYFENHKISG